jgi:hypothetical protein
VSVETRGVVVRELFTDAGGREGSGSKQAVDLLGIRGWIRYGHRGR